MRHRFYLLDNEYIFTFINKFSNIFFGVIVSIFLTRYSGAELKGEYAVISNTLSIFALFANLGIYQAYPKYKRDGCIDVKKKFVNIFYLQFIFLCLIAILCVIADFNSVVFVLLPLVVLSNQLNFVVMVEDVYFKNKANILSSIVNVIYTLVLYFFCERNLVFLLGSLVIVDLFLDCIYLIKLKVKPDFSCLSFGFVFEILKYSFVPMLSSLLVSLNYKFDIIMLDMFHINNFYIGQYSLAVSLVGYAWLIPDIFKEVLFSKTAMNDSVNEINICLKISNFFCIVCTILICLFGYFAIYILFGEEFLSAYPVLMILFLGVPAMSWFKIISTLYLAQGKRMFYFYVLLFSVLLNVLLNYLSIPYWNIYGAAVASIFSYTICGYCFLHNYTKLYNIRLVSLFKFDRNFINELKLFFGGRNGNKRI